ncbi:MAG: hypothetical protein QXY70_01120 [Nanopusillaceae archaeon]
MTSNLLQNLFPELGTKPQSFNLEPSFLNTTYIPKKEETLENPRYRRVETDYYTAYYDVFGKTTSVIIPKYGYDVKIETTNNDNRLAISVYNKEGEKVKEYIGGYVNPEVAMSEAAKKATITSIAIPGLILLGSGAAAGGALASVIKTALISGAISVPIGAGIRGGITYFITGDLEKTKEAIIKPEYIITDFVSGATGGAVKGLTSLLPYFSISPYKYVGTGLASFSGILTYDVVSDIVSKREIKIAEPIEIKTNEKTITIPGWGLYVAGALIPPALHYLGDKIYTAHVRGSLPLPKIGYAKRGDESVIALTIEKGPESKPIIGIKISSDKVVIGSGKQLSFSKLYPEEGIPKSPLEAALLREAMKKYYIDKHGFSYPEFEKTFEAIKEIYKRYSETPSLSLKEVLKLNQRISDKAEEVYNLIRSDFNAGKIKIYGSASIKMYGKDIIPREIHDIDVKEIVPGTAEKILEGLKKIFGNEIRIVDLGYGYQVYRNINGNYLKIMEIFKSGSGYGQIQQGIGYGFKPLPPKLSPSGEIIQSLEQSTAEKFASAFGIHEKYMGPELHRFKDIIDLSSLLKHYYQKQNINKIGEAFEIVSKKVLEGEKTFFGLEAFKPNVKPMPYVSPPSIPSLPSEQSKYTPSIPSVSVAQESKISTPSISKTSESTPSTSTSSSPPSQTSESSATSLSKRTTPIYIPPPVISKPSEESKSKSKSISIPSYSISPPSPPPYYVYYSTSSPSAQNQITLPAPPFMFFLIPFIDVSFSTRSFKIPTVWVSETKYIA